MLRRSHRLFYLSPWLDLLFLLLNSFQSTDFEPFGNKSVRASSGVPQPLGRDL